MKKRLLCLILACLLLTTGVLPYRSGTADAQLVNPGSRPTGFTNQNPFT